MRIYDEHDYADAIGVFEWVARDAIANNGGTYDRRTGARIDYTSGYSVGVGAIGTIAREYFYAPELVACWPRSERDNCSVGIWYDSECYCVDWSQHIEDLSLALAVARARGEQAIWDCANRCEIKVVY